MSIPDSTKPILPQLLESNGPVCLIFTAQLAPLGDVDRFQPAGFPEVGHVIYDAPRVDKNGNRFKEKVCILDSPASMANHLETVCLAGQGTTELHAALAELPYVTCVTDSEIETNGGQIVPKPNSPKERAVVSTFTEGHRLASDYFLDARKLTNGRASNKTFREELRDEFKIIEVKKDKTYFIPPETWWNIFKTIFTFDPNSLVHGVMFAKEQIKISRLLTAHLEAFGASRVGRSGVKFDRLQKTTSGQPIFAVDEETAQEIRATFVLDLAMLRSYGRGESGLSLTQKSLLLNLALWKISQLLQRPFRYRTQCFLRCEHYFVATEDGLVRVSDPAKPKNNQKSGSQQDDADGRADINRADAELAESSRATDKLLAEVEIKSAIANCKFTHSATKVYYPANELFKAGKEDAGTAKYSNDATSDEDEPDDDN